VIDFRYHIVSLISVFLALAVGIVLGAGPLKGPISDQLAVQVERLRVEKDSLRADLDAQTARGDTLEEFVAQGAPELLAGTLAGRNLAVIAIGEGETGDEQRFASFVDMSGATIGARVSVTEKWWAEQHDQLESEIRSLSGNGSGNLLARGLAQSILGTTQSGPMTSTETELYSLLVSEGVVTYSGAVPKGCDGVIVIYWNDEQSGDVKDAQIDAQIDARAQSIVAITDTVASLVPTVLLGPEQTKADPVAIVLDDSVRAEVTSTVDSSMGSGSTVTALRALALRYAGTVGHFGKCAVSTSVVCSAFLPPRSGG
jgi:hypothetical protein